MYRTVSGRLDRHHLHPFVKDLTEQIHSNVQGGPTFQSMSGLEVLEYQWLDCRICMYIIWIVFH